MQLLNRVFLPLLLTTTGLVPSASAQALRGTVRVGVAVSMVRPAAPELTTRPSVTPTFGRVPSEGWGLAVAFQWFEANVDARLVGGEGRLGRLNVRPLMFGIGYTAVRNRISLSPSFVAGPALNTLSISDEASDRFEVAGTPVETRFGSVSVAMRAGVTATYAFYPRLGLTASGGYVWNRPTLVLRTPDGERRERWQAGGLLLSSGVVVTLF